MKISLPRQIPMRYLLPFLGTLLVLQMVEGASVITVVAYCLFVLIMADAFNTVGGMVYPSGAYIFFALLLTVGVGGVAKTALGEALDSNIPNAQKSLFVYVAGACSIWVAARIAAATRRKKPLLSAFHLNNDQLEQAALGSALVGQYAVYLIPAAVVASFNQVNSFLPLGLFLAVYAATRRSDGWRSFSILGFCIWIWTTVVWGIFGFSKQGIFSPSLTWAVAATLGGYRLSLKKAVVVALAAVAASAVLTPFSQVGRVYREQPDSRAKAIELLMHPLETRERYSQNQAYVRRNGTGYNWFNQPQGLLDRMTMFPIDAALIALTDDGHSPGIFPIATYVANTIPRYFVSEKLQYHWGNHYAHELGLLGKNDFNTGISFSPFSDAYHCVQWWGVTLISLPIFLMMFWVCDSVTGSTDQELWAITYLLIFSHSAPEGMMNAPFAAISTNLVAAVLAAVVSRYVTPVIGSMLMPFKHAFAPPPAPAHWVPASSGVGAAGARTIDGKL